MNKAVLFTYNLDSRGGGEQLDRDISSLPQQDKDGLLWLHLNINDPDAAFILQQQKCLDSFLIEALIADETRPRVVQVNDDALLILRGVNLNKNEDPEDMVSIRLWISKNKIISTERRRLKTILDIEDKVKNNKGPKNTGEFLCMLTSQLLEYVNATLLDLDEKMDEIEEVF
ncbi:MAG: zinc transporter [Alphaproteobacteria bacterium]|jgi:zinc transporter